VIVKKKYSDIIEEDIMNLIYPSNTHMDFNIASALKFASEGKGYKLSPEFFEKDEFKEFLVLLDNEISQKLLLNIEEQKSFDEGIITKFI